jgi:hypothetical protein
MRAPSPSRVHQASQADVSERAGNVGENLDAHHVDLT